MVMAVGLSHNLIKTITHNIQQLTKVEQINKCPKLILKLNFQLFLIIWFLSLSRNILIIRPRRSHIAAEKTRKISLIYLFVYFQFTIIKPISFFFPLSFQA